jgi:hypothetical protein
MFKITEGPIHYMEKRCVVPAKKRINKDMLQRYGNDYANNERFNNLGVPMFIMNITNDSRDDEIAEQHHEGMISDELFDELFERVIQKPKKKSPRTLKKRGKKDKKGKK